VVTGLSLALVQSARQQLITNRNGHMLPDVRGAFLFDHAKGEGATTSTIRPLRSQCQQTTNALPFRSDRKGITPMAAFEEMIRLLLVVHRGALVFLALCIGSIDCDRAALAIGRDHNVGRKNNLSAFF
jgi:hypothetical protein